MNEDKRWLYEYSYEDSFWKVISPLGVILTRTPNKKQAIEIVREMNSQTGDNHGKSIRHKPR